VSCRQGQNAAVVDCANQFIAIGSIVRAHVADDFVLDGIKLLFDPNGTHERPTGLQWSAGMGRLDQAKESSKQSVMLFLNNGHLSQR